jgi:hypothetical protein
MINTFEHNRNKKVYLLLIDLKKQDMKHQKI